MALSRQKVEWERSSLICAILANCSRDPKRKPFSPDEFNPYAKKKESVINDKGMFMEALKAAFVKEGKKK